MDQDNSANPAELPPAEDGTLNASNGGNEALDAAAGQAPVSESQPAQTEPAAAEPAAEEPAPQTPSGQTAPLPAPSHEAPDGQGAAAPAFAPPANSFIKNLLAKASEKIQFNKKKKLEKIAALARQKGKITNADVCKLLRVSNATAFRYLNILEKQGKIKQTGKTGRDVFYQPAG